MARVPIYLEVRTDAGASASGATVTVKKRSDGLNASLFTAESGGGAASNPMTTDSKGRALAWADPDDWNLQVAGSGITSYTVPYDGTPEILDNSITSPKILDGAVTDAKLTMQVASMWIPVILPQSMTFAPGTSYTQRHWTQDGTANNPNQYGPKAQLGVYIDPAAYTFAGRTTNWRLQLTYGVNAFSTGTTIAVDLIRVTTSQATSSDFSFGSFTGPHITATMPNIASSSVGSINTDVTGNLGGTAGVFTFWATSAAAIAASSRANITAMLLVRWT